MRKIVWGAGAVVALSWLVGLGAQPAEEADRYPGRETLRDERLRQHQERVRQTIAERRDKPDQGRRTRKDDVRKTSEVVFESGASAGEEPMERDSPRPEGTVRTVLSEAPIERVLATIEQQTGVHVVPRGRVRGQRISLLVRDVPLTSALEMIVSSKEGWILVQPPDRPGTYQIWDKNTYDREIVYPQLPFRVFELRHMPADEARRVVGILLSSNMGTVISAPSTGRIVVRARAEELDQVGDLLRQIDQPSLVAPQPPPAVPATPLSAIERRATPPAAEPSPPVSTPPDP